MNGNKRVQRKRCEMYVVAQHRFTNTTVAFARGEKLMDTALGNSSVNTCYEVDAAQAFAQQPSGIREFAAISP
jgi:hypothetical protein